MGQAFDRDGQVLGEAFGDTKRDVFDQLAAAHPEANELRIKSLTDKLPASDRTETVPYDRMLQFFAYMHLPERLQIVSKPYCELAFQIVKTQPSNPERTAGLRKLLEAKDCGVRALLYE